jgi:hypothetical protein
MIVIQENTNGVSNNNKGLEVESSIYRTNNGLILHIIFNNKSSGININNLIIQFNKNYFGLYIDPNCLNNINIQPNQIIEKFIPITINQPDITKIPQNNPPFTIQTGLRCNLNEYYFVIPIMFCVLFIPQSNIISIQQYQNLFMNIQNNDSGIQIDNLKYQNINSIIERLKNNCIYLVNRNDNQNGDSQLYFYSILTNNQTVFTGIMFNPNQSNSCNLMCKSESYFLIQYTLHAIKFILTTDY